ncbi:MAG: YceI family protein [Bacteroidota bacterium]
MRILAYALILLTCLSFTHRETVLVHRFIVQPSSKITINGRTNINSFQCATARYNGKDTLVLVEGNRRKPFFEKGFVGLEAASFDCGMQVMTHDFSKTIKAREYPSISIELISFERIPVYTSTDKFRGKMKISLAGVTKTFLLDCSIEPKETGTFHLRGNKNFKFADFGLEAPQKAMGLIKVDDNLLVDFHLVLQLDTNL